MNYLEQYGQMLLDNGYDIVPIAKGEKYPKGINDWRRKTTDDKLLKRYIKQGFEGVGIKATNTPAVDIDVRDDTISNQMQDFIESIFFDDEQIIKRVGEAPKCLIMCRTDKPFTKMTSTKYVDMFDDTHQIEILGDGQQYVAFAIHPDTNEPYTYLNETNPSGIKSDELPFLTVELAQEIIDYFESIVPDDWEQVADTKRAGGLARDVDPLELVKPRVGLSDDEIRETLKFVNPNIDYHKWVNVLMAIYHETNGSEDGFVIADEWSRQGTSYNSGDVRKRWDGLDAKSYSSDPVTFKTAMKYAKDAGMAEKLSGDLVEPMNKIQEFRNRTNNVRHDVPAPTKQEPDRLKNVPVHLAWLAHEDRKTAEGGVFRPDRDGERLVEEGGLLWINEFSMPVHDADDAVESQWAHVFDDHMDYILPVKKEREWFIDWMAFNVQYPARRCLVTPLHVSKAHGTGRGWIVKLMNALLGEWNCTKTKMPVLCGEGSAGAFNDYLNDSLLCAIEEVKEGDKRFGISDKVRDILTEDLLEINIKFGDKRTKRVYTNFFMMSNHDDALVIPMEDRRINVLQGVDYYKEGSYYDDLYSALGCKHFINAIYRRLMSRDLSAFNFKRSMKTRARGRMINQNRNQTEDLFYTFLEDNESEGLTMKQVVKKMEDIGGGDGFDTDINETQLTKLLQQNSSDYLRLKVRGKVVRVWVLKGDASNEMLRESVEKAGDL